MKPVVIRNSDQLLAAMKRVETLSGAAGGSPEETERAELADAIKVYEDSLLMMRTVAKKAADEESEGVASISGAE